MGEDDGGGAGGGLLARSPPTSAGEQWTTSDACGLCELAGFSQTSVALGESERPVANGIQVEVAGHLAGLLRETGSPMGRQHDRENLHRAQGCLNAEVTGLWPDCLADWSFTGGFPIFPTD